MPRKHLLLLTLSVLVLVSACDPKPSIPEEEVFASASFRYVAAGLDKPIAVIAASPDGSRLVAASDDGQVVCADADGETIWSGSVAGGLPVSMCVSDGGATTFVSTADISLGAGVYSTVTALDASGEELWAVKTPEGTVAEVRIAADGRTGLIATLPADVGSAELAFVDPTTGMVSATVQYDPAAPPLIDATPDLRLVTLSCSDPTGPEAQSVSGRFYAIIDGVQTLEEAASPAAVTAVTGSTGIVAVDGDGTCRMYAYENGSWSMSEGAQGVPHPSLVRSDGTQLTVFTQSIETRDEFVYAACAMTVRNIMSGQESWSHTFVSAQPRVARALEDGLRATLVPATPGTGTALIVSLANGSAASLPEGTSAISSSADGGFTVFGTVDGRIGVVAE